MRKSGNKELYLWSTDLHLDFVSEKIIAEFISRVNATNAKGLFITGDIANGLTLCRTLDLLSSGVETEIYFVLGNHDFYGSSIAKTKHTLRDFLPAFKNLHELGEGMVIPLAKDVALVGHHGWADGLAGDFLNSTVSLRDYFEIADFIGKGKKELAALLKNLGCESQLEMERTLKKAFENFSEVIVLTHVPPFLEGARYHNHLADENWSPHFVCYQMGEMLLKLMKENPEKKLLVFSGHSHHEACYSLLPNLRCCTGFAEYGRPSFQELWL